MNAFWKLYHRDLSRCLIGAVLIISAGCNGGLSAFKETRKAAEMGYTNAQFNLSNMYRVGEGVPKNDKKAVTWYRKAAEQGNATAQHNLGWMYYKGEGVPENDAEAVTWYRKAAYQGNAIAQGNLGTMYCKGEGVPENYEEAYKWFLLAAAKGEEKVKEAMTTFEGLLTAKQGAEGQRRAAAYHAKESQ